MSKVEIEAGKAEAGVDAGVKGNKAQVQDPQQAAAQVQGSASGPELTDERSGRALALRALAHPLRWKLIDLLGMEESATATRCAAVLGESVPSCAYHLGILAKYGYIELVPDHAGREKPWRLTSYKQVLSGEGLGIEGEMAALAAADAFLDHEVARIKETWRRKDQEMPSWRDASGLLGATFWATAEELAEITGQLTQIALRYSDRLESPEKRPEGARLARVFFSSSVAPLHHQRPATTRGQG